MRAVHCTGTETRGPTGLVDLFGLEYGVAVSDGLTYCSSKRIRRLAYETAEGDRPRHPDKSFVSLSSIDYRRSLSAN